MMGLPPALGIVVALVLAGSPAPNRSDPRQSELLVEAVTRQNSSAFQENRAAGFFVKTTPPLDSIPYFVGKPGTAQVCRYPGERVRLSGDKKGAASYRVDNHLVVEIRDGGRVQRVFVGYGEPLFYRGRQVMQVGRAAFDLNADEIDLAPYFPAGRAVTVRVFALDYGGVGFVSNIYLIVDRPRDARLDAFISPGFADPFDIPDDLKDEGI